MNFFESHLKIKTYSNDCKTKIQITMSTNGKMNSEKENTFLKTYVSILTECRLTKSVEITLNQISLMINLITGLACFHQEKIKNESCLK